METSVDRELTLAELARLGRPLNVRANALTLDNFKSFPRPTRIPIRDGFTTVSGPNGSGKSNLIDALQFVLAVSTSKTMRAERLTDLISTLGNKPKCKVSLELDCTFEDPDGGGPIDKLIELARSVRRRKSGAEVKYYLNGNVIRLADLRDILTHLGLPTSGQNFVLQNDVIRLTSMGGVARRQVLDELAGAKEFDHRIGMANEELAATDRIAEDTTLVLAELAKRLEQLRVERDQALAFQELTSSKQSMEEDLVILDVTEAEVAVVKQEEAIAESEKAQVKGEREHKKKSEAEAIARQALDELEQELATKGEGERMDAFRAVESLRTRIETTKDGLREVQAERDAAAKRAPGLEQAVEEAQKAVRSAEGLAKDIETELQTKLDKLSIFSQRFEACGASLQQEGKDRFERADRMRQLRKQSETLRTDEAKLAARDRELAEQLSRGEAERAMLAEQVNDGGSHREEVHKNAVAAAAAFREKRENYAKLEERRRRLVAQITNLRSGLETIASRVSQAQSQVAAAQAQREQALTHGGGRALQSLRDAGIQGIHAPVANLVKFKSRYADAIEAAAGGRLNWLVVDDEHVVGRAIAHLKRTNSGKLSFAPLSRIKGRSGGGKAPRGKGVVGFAIDLVDADRQYNKVLSEVFGDTLVMESFEDTKRYIGQYRMVTLDGDVVNKNAIMTGGSKGRRGGLLAAAARMGELVTEREKALSGLVEQRDRARNAVRVAETELTKVAEEAAVARAELAQAESTSSALNVELTRLEDGLGPQAKRLATLEDQLAAVTQELEQLTPRLAEVRSALAEIEGRATDLDDPGGSAAFEELQKQASELEDQMRPLEKEVDRLRQEHGQALAAHSGAVARLEAAQAARVEANKAAEVIGQKFERLQGALTTQTDALKEKEAELAELSSELMALTRRRNEAREALDAAHDAASEAKLRVETILERLAELARTLIELKQVAATKRAEAEEREIEVPGPEEAPLDMAKERSRIGKALAKVTREIEKLGGVNHLAIEQCEQTEQRHGELEEKIETLRTEKEQIQLRIVNLQGKKRIAFLEAFAQVRDAFADTYRELGRGEGQLSLENPQDPFAGGLNIKVRPRGKKLSRMEIMSGGEKALTALALIFALQEVNPAALFVFDEVDKDLDSVNTKILAAAIQRRASERQYMVISHHRCLLEHSNQTLGVTQRQGLGTQVTGVAMTALPEAEAENTAQADTADMEMSS